MSAAPERVWVRTIRWAETERAVKLGPTQQGAGWWPKRRVQIRPVRSLYDPALSDVWIVMAEVNAPDAELLAVPPETWSPT